MSNEYKSPRNLDRESQSPEMNFQAEFHPSHSSASGKFHHAHNCECLASGLEHFEWTLSVLRKINEEFHGSRKKASNG